MGKLSSIFFLRIWNHLNSKAFYEGTFMISRGYWFSFHHFWLLNHSCWYQFSQIYQSIHLTNYSKVAIEGSIDWSL